MPRYSAQISSLPLMYSGPLSTHILTTREDCEAWLDAPTKIALRLQRPLPDGSLRLVEGPI